MSLRDQLIKAAGLFVEVTPETPATPGTVPETPVTHETVTPEQTAPAKTVEHLVRESDGPNLADITASAAAIPPTTTAAKDMDFSALYQHAGLPVAPFTAEQTLDMLSSLSNDIPLEAKRQTVRATLNAMGKSIGATPETIVTDASRKLAALTAYVDDLKKATEEFCAASELEIANLQAQVAEKRKNIDAARQKHAQTAKACSDQADRLDEVLEFFSLDVPPSKYAAEKKA